MIMASYKHTNVTRTQIVGSFKARKESSLPPMRTYAVREATVPTDTGVVLPEGLPREEWCAMLRQAVDAERQAQWLIGQLLAYGEDNYGPRYTKEAVESLGRAYGTLRNLAWVWRQFASSQVSRRRDTVPFSHHQEVAPLLSLAPEKAEELLDRAETEGLSREYVRKEVRHIRLTQRVQERRARALAGPDVHISGVKLHNVDCMIHMRAMADNTVLLLIADIPYDETNRPSAGLRSFDKGSADMPTFNLEEFLAEAVRVTSGSLYIFCGQEQFSTVKRNFREAGLSTRALTWWKTDPAPVNAEHNWLQATECLVFGKKSGAVFNGFCEPNVLRFPSVRNAVHPTQKPLELTETLILTSSLPGDVVFDPVAGSGTTGVAAMRTGRSFEGCELNEEYYRDALQRLHETQAQLLVSAGADEGEDS